MEREAGTKVSDEARTSRHRLFQGGARKLADSLGLWKRPERCEAEDGVTPHFPSNETLFSSLQHQWTYPFLSLVSATSDTDTEGVCPSVGKHALVVFCRCQFMSWVFRAAAIGVCEFRLRDWFSPSASFPFPPVSPPSLLELVSTYRCACACAHTPFWAVTSTRNCHQAVCLITVCVQEVSTPALPKHSLATSSPGMPLLEIVVFGKLLVQGCVPSAALQLCNEHTRAAFHFLEDRRTA